MFPLVAACLVALSLADPPPEPKLRRYTFSEIHMGMSFNLTLYAANETAANQAAAEAFRRIAALDAAMSDYKPQSELSRLSQTAGSGRAVPVSRDLWEVLRRSQELAVRSEGAFDITVGPLVRLWRRARRQKELPDPQRLAEAREAVGYRWLRLNEENRSVELLRPGMRLDLGGIAAGYACDEALRLLAEKGIRRAMVEASGDIRVGDPPPGREGWRVGIAPLEPDGKPSRYLELRNQAVTTSGDAFQFVEIGGQRYSHIVDPRTGVGLTTRSSVTVVAPACTTADSLATAVSVLGPEAGLKLVDQTPQAAALIVVSTDEGLKVYESSRWDEVAERAAGGRAAPVQRGSPDEYRVGERGRQPPEFKGCRGRSAQRKFRRA